MLLIAGSDEFLPPGAPPASVEKTRDVAEVFSLMGYDLGMLSPEEASMLDAAGASPGPGFTTAGAVRTMVLPLADGRRAGVILFPSWPAGLSAPTREMAAALDNATAGLDGEAQVVVGLSSWGYFNEKAYLQMAQRPVDILLGSGPGLGLSGKLEAKGRTMWVRPYSRGKSILQIEVLSWPERTPGFRWTPEAIRATSKPLDEKVRPDPEAASILADTPQQ